MTRRYDSSMQGSPKEVFRSVRRLYRVTRKLPHHHQTSVDAHTAAVQAMRKVTGKWDLCDPPSWHSRTHGSPLLGYPRYYRQMVYAACSHWLAGH